MNTLARLSRDLFLLAHAGASAGESGLAWERRLAAYFAERGVRTDPLPGGTTVLGHTALSGIGHQVDSVVAAADGYVIAEWKAHRGSIPKNELLRFRAVSDDYVQGLGRDAPRKPLVRMFGGPGAYRTEVRRYAALHGILLIDTDRWPIPVLVADSAIWRQVGLAQPSALERRSLASLVQPVQDVLQLQRDGSYRIPRPPSRLQLDSLLDLHEHWSDRLWEAIDDTPGTFESLTACAERREAA